VQLAAPVYEYATQLARCTGSRLRTTRQATQNSGEDWHVGPLGRVARSYPGIKCPRVFLEVAPPKCAFLSIGKCRHWFIDSDQLVAPCIESALSAVVSVVH